MEHLLVAYKCVPCVVLLPVLSASYILLVCAYVRSVLCCKCKCIILHYTNYSNRGLFDLHCPHARPNQGTVKVMAYRIAIFFDLSQTLLAEQCVQ